MCTKGEDTGSDWRRLRLSKGLHVRHHKLNVFRLPSYIKRGPNRLSRSDSHYTYAMLCVCLHIMYFLKCVSPTRVVYIFFFFFFFLPTQEQSRAAVTLKMPRRARVRRTEICYGITSIWEDCSVY